MRDTNQHDVAVQSRDEVHELSVTNDGREGAVASTQYQGNRKAWLRVFGSFLVFVNIWGLVFIFGVFQSFYELSYIPSESPSSISWVGTVQSALLSIIGVLTGPLFDLGGYRLMTIAGALLVLLGLFTLSWSTAYYQIFLSQGLCIGIGGGLLYVPSLALVSTSFTAERRVLALGTLTCGIGIGGIIYVAVFQRLLPKVGFAWTIRIIGLIATTIFGLAMPTLLLNSPRKQRSQTRKLFSKAALRDMPFVAYSIASFMIFLGYLIPFFYIPSYAQVVLKTPASTGFWALAVSSATSIAGRLGSALIAQRIGIMASWVASCAISAALCFCWAAVRSVQSLYAFSALYGCFSGALVALPPAIFPRICKDANQLGTWMGMGWFASGVSFLIGAPIAGALIKVGETGSNGYNFLAVQLMSGLLLTLGTVGLIILWMLLVKTRSGGVPA
ncbi:MFS transporter, MCP family, solute carrier family 16, member 10 [Xylogone sp. PMI_703]|nr:MFS transporter, MCP family, solute carrier family 16, member 10 [Xylogone sp. PMI_703]